MLQAANRYKEPIFFSDLTIRHPEKNNSELLWHCGNFPYSLKAKDSPASVRWHGEVFPGVAHWRLKKGEITVARFDGDKGSYSLLMGHAHSVEGPDTSGTYLWVEVNDWPLWEEKFIRGPYIHHVAGIYGKFAPVLYEACRYIPELIPDAVDPDEEELKKWLRE
jgi:L-fucose isomerase-like protein